MSLVVPIGAPGAGKPAIAKTTERGYRDHVPVRRKRLAFR